MKLRITLVAANVAFLLTWAATAALGHAALVTSDPPAGDIIMTPYTLTATFDEELTPKGSSIVVQDSTGKQVAAGTVSTSDDKSMTAELPALDFGQYEVLWTAVTADDLAIERGTYHFNVGSHSVSIPPGQPTPDPNASTTNNKDVLIALIPAGVIAAAIAGLLLYRNRRPR